MNQLSQVDLHPDAHSLNAFVQRALPKVEQQKLLAHVADCDRCRQIIHLAQDAGEESTLESHTQIPSATRSARNEGWLEGWSRWEVIAAPVCVVLALVAAAVPIARSLHRSDDSKPTATAASTKPAPQPQAAPPMAAAGAKPSVAGAAQPKLTPRVTPPPPETVVVGRVIVTPPPQPPTRPPVSPELKDKLDTLEPPVAGAVQPNLPPQVTPPPPQTVVVGKVIVTPPPAPPARPPISRELKDKLDVLEPEIDGLKTRAAAVNNSLNTMQRSMQRNGLGLRGDVAAKQASMNLNLGKTEQAFNTQDTDRASRFAALTEPDVEALETFLGLPLSTAVAAPAQQRKRVAVMNFDATPDAKQKAGAQFGMQNDLGATFADLVVNKLTQDGKFTLLERSQLDKIIKEHDQSNSDRADQATAIKLGKIAGVDRIIIGSVTQFTGDTATSTTLPTTVFGHTIPGTSSTTITVTVGVTARLIDTATGAILASATGTGTAQTKQGSRTGPFGGSTQGDTKTKLSNDATTQAIDQIVTQIEAALGPTVASAYKPAPPPPLASDVPKVPYKGAVAEVSGTTLVLNVGTSSGLKVGDTVEILRFNHAIKDPTTGKVIRTIKVGEAKIIEADATSSVATYMGTGTVAVKDIATFKQ